MPNVAFAATAMFAIWVIVRKFAFYRSHASFEVFGTATCLAIRITLVYFGIKGLLWVKQRVLWRVRRRLLITYLFVGGTPIVLLCLLGALAWFAVSNEAMARILGSQLAATDHDVAATAHALADAYSRESRMDDRETADWLNKQVALLEHQMPGIRIELWKSSPVQKMSETYWVPSKITSRISDDPQTRLFSADEAQEVDRLPEWLEGKNDWSGFSFIPPEDTYRRSFGTASFRSLIRGKANNTQFSLLVVLPVTPAYINRLQTNTGLSVQPYFVAVNNRRLTYSNRRPDDSVDQAGESAESPDLNLRVDQAGAPINSTVSPVLVSSINWQTGEKSDNLAFFFGWSWAAARQSILEGGFISDLFKRLLLITGIVFLVLELLALLSVAWITRAITGTVHKLYLATGFINRGDFSHRVSVKSRDQLGELAGAFNEMSSNIESLLKERVERERLQREIEIAAEVQSRLFPSEIPPLTTIDISAECRAARGVAGDYYDYVEIQTGLVMIALGDVSGKGISASLVMSNLQASLRAQSSMIAERMPQSAQAANVFPMGLSPGASRDGLAISRTPAFSVQNIVASVNHQLCRSTDSNRFATLVVGFYDERTRTFRYTNAGHNQPILVRATGAVERLTEGGMMVGAFDWAKYNQETIQLNPGDALVLFSDGLSEAERSAGEEFGEQRLVEIIQANRNLSADEIRHRIFEEIQAWTGPIEPADDQTVVIIKSRDKTGSVADLEQLI